jgi:hypothetical protein
MFDEYMKIRELKDLLSKIDDDKDICFAVFDEYGVEVEGNIKFKSLHEGNYNDVYITLSAKSE